MKKINDRIQLGIFSGFVGLIALSLVDILSSKLGISQRSYRTTAAGVWVSSRREAEKWSGQLLGVIMKTGLSMLGGVGIVSLLTRYGRDKLVTKGLFFGVSFGAIITAMLSGFTKVKPKDALSNLSYIVSNCAYGLATIFTANKIGDDSLFDSPPLNDYSKPTDKTTEQKSKDNIVQSHYYDLTLDTEETTLM